MIMKVACFFSQHSPILGQPASSQTVTSFSAFTIFWVSAHLGEPGALTRIQSGLRRIGFSGRFCFSGWRSSGFTSDFGLPVLGRGSRLRRSSTTAMDGSVTGAAQQGAATPV